MGELLLVRAVVIHLPDFFGAAAIADEVDLGFGDSGDAATQAKDDFVGKTMCDQTSVGAVCFLVVLLSKHLWRLNILGVVQPTLDIKGTALNSNVAERQHVRIGRRAPPIREMHLLRSARNQ